MPRSPGGGGFLLLIGDCISTEGTGGSCGGEKGLSGIGWRDAWWGSGWFPEASEEAFSGAFRWILGNRTSAFADCIGPAATVGVGYG